MPHKIYQCCDANTCTCGNWEKVFSSNYDRAEENKTYLEKQQLLKQFSLEELKVEINNRKYEVKAKKIKKLKEELKKLEES